MVRYSDTDNRKGREQLRPNLPPPRQISTLLRTWDLRPTLDHALPPQMSRCKMAALRKFLAEASSMVSESI
jgi:hypothetical protein